MADPAGIYVACLFIAEYLCIAFDPNFIPICIQSTLYHLQTCVHKSLNWNCCSNIHNSFIRYECSIVSQCDHIGSKAPMAETIFQSDHDNAPPPAPPAPHSPHKSTAAQTKSAAQRESTRCIYTYMYTYLPLTITRYTSAGSPQSPSARIRPHVSKQTVNGNRRTLRKCCRRQLGGDGGGLRNVWLRKNCSISGTSRATYLYKFMATSNAICLCQLMTGPIQKS